MVPPLRTRPQGARLDDPTPEAEPLPPRTEAPTPSGPLDRIVPTDATPPRGEITRPEHGLAPADLAPNAALGEVDRLEDPGPAGTDKHTYRVRPLPIVLVGLREGMRATEEQRAPNRAALPSDAKRYLSWGVAMARVGITDAQLTHYLNTGELSEPMARALAAASETGEWQALNATRGFMHAGIAAARARASTLDAEATRLQSQLTAAERSDALDPAERERLRVGIAALRGHAAELRDSVERETARSRQLDDGSSDARLAAARRMSDPREAALRMEQEGEHLARMGAYRRSGTPERRACDSHASEVLVEAAARRLSTAAPTLEDATTTRRLLGRANQLTPDAARELPRLDLLADAIRVERATHTERGDTRAAFIAGDELLQTLEVRIAATDDAQLTRPGERERLAAAHEEARDLHMGRGLILAEQQDAAHRLADTERHIAALERALGGGPNGLAAQAEALRERIRAHQARASEADPARAEAERRVATNLERQVQVIEADAAQARERLAAARDGRTRLAAELDAADARSLALGDALGTRTPLLHDALIGAERHALRLDGLLRAPSVEGEPAERPAFDAALQLGQARFHVLFSRLAAVDDPSGGNDARLHEAARAVDDADRRIAALGDTGDALAAELRLDCVRVRGEVGEAIAPVSGPEALRMFRDAHHALTRLRAGSDGPDGATLDALTGELAESSGRAREQMLRRAAGGLSRQGQTLRVDGESPQALYALEQELVRGIRADEVRSPQEARLAEFERELSRVAELFPAARADLLAAHEDARAELAILDERLLDANDSALGPLSFLNGGALDAATRERVAQIQTDHYDSERRWGEAAIDAMAEGWRAASPDGEARPDRRLVYLALLQSASTDASERSALAGGRQFAQQWQRVTTEALGAFLPPVPIDLRDITPERATLLTSSLRLMTPSRRHYYGGNSFQTGEESVDFHVLRDVSVLRDFFDQPGNRAAAVLGDGTRPPRGAETRVIRSGQRLLGRYAEMAESESRKWAIMQAVIAAPVGVTASIGIGRLALGARALRQLPGLARGLTALREVAPRTFAFGKSSLDMGLVLGVATGSQALSAEVMGRRHWLTKVIGFTGGLLSSGMSTQISRVKNLTGQIAIAEAQVLLSQVVLPEWISDPDALFWTNIGIGIIVPAGLSAWGTGRVAQARAAGIADSVAPESAGGASRRELELALSRPLSELSASDAPPPATRFAAIEAELDAAMLRHGVPPATRQGITRALRCQWAFDAAARELGIDLNGTPTLRPGDATTLTQRVATRLIDAGVPRAEAFHIASIHVSATLGGHAAARVRDASAETLVVFANAQHEAVRYGVAQRDAGRPEASVETLAPPAGGNDSPSGDVPGAPRDAPPVQQGLDPAPVNDARVRQGLDALEAMPAERRQRMQQRLDEAPPDERRILLGLIAAHAEQNTGQTPFAPARESEAPAPRHRPPSAHRNTWADAITDERLATARPEAREFMLRLTGELDTGFVNSDEALALVQRTFFVRGQHDPVAGYDDVRALLRRMEVLFDQPNASPRQLLESSRALGLVQYYSASCAPTALQLLAAESHPLLALELVAGGRDQAAQAQRQMLADDGASVEPAMHHRGAIGAPAQRVPGEVAAPDTTSGPVRGLSDKPSFERWLALKRRFDPSFEGAIDRQRDGLEHRLWRSVSEDGPTVIGVRNPRGSRHAVLVTRAYTDADGARWYELRDPRHPTPQRVAAEQLETGSRKLGTLDTVFRRADTEPHPSEALTAMAAVLPSADVAALRRLDTFNLGTRVGAGSGDDLPRIREALADLAYPEMVAVLERNGFQPSPQQSRGRVQVWQFSAPRGRRTTVELRLGADAAGEAARALPPLAGLPRPVLRDTLGMAGFVRDPVRDVSARDVPARDVPARDVSEVWRHPDGSVVRIERGDGVAHFTKEIGLPEVGPGHPERPDVVLARLSDDGRVLPADSDAALPLLRAWFFRQAERHLQALPPGERVRQIEESWRLVEPSLLRHAEALGRIPVGSD